jgi:hypothetical protein
MIRSLLINCFFRRSCHHGQAFIIQFGFLQDEDEVTWKEIVQFCPKQPVGNYLDLLVGKSLFNLQCAA